MAETSTQTIRRFYDRAASIDFARDFLFRVRNINVVSGGVNLVDMGDNELVYVRTASIPGRNINNVEAKFMGLSFNVPGGVTYPGSSDYSLEFYCDANSDLRESMMSASFQTFDDLTSTGLYSTPGRDSYITLDQLDQDLNIVVTYRLVGVSIRNVSDISYEIAEGTGNYKTFTATFAYHYWEAEGGLP